MQCTYTYSYHCLLAGHVRPPRRHLPMKKPHNHVDLKVETPVPPFPIPEPALSSSESDSDELGRMELARPLAHRKVLSKQLSMTETRRDAAWERRRRQMMGMKRRRTALGHSGLEGRSLTDEDLDELKGSIELGFGFSEKDGAKLSGTLPALDFFFAINRYTVSTPSALSSSSSLSSYISSSIVSPRSPSQNESSWKICAPGDTPQMVKTRLRHWARLVACMVRLRQNSYRAKIEKAAS